MAQNYQQQQPVQPAHKASAWEKTKSGGKAAFDKGWSAFEKLGVPVNKLTNKIGSEAFWPQNLGAESDKAARILKSFCKDGFYTEQPASRPGSPGPKNKPKVLVKIPQKVIQNCVGLAIFSTMRTGLWVSGAGGSGVLVAKKDDGSWSPPSGILVHTLGVGFMAGIDIYDCVIVINNKKALEAFSKMRLSLGGEVSVVAGPVGTGGILESELLKNRKPVFSYMKSRGLYAGIQADGTIIIERNDENARFYGEKLPVGAILAGQVRKYPAETRLLMEVLKQAEGRTDLNPTILQQVDQQPAPSDLDVEHMSEPTADQKTNFAPPQTSGHPVEGYYAPPAQTGSGYPTDYKHSSGATQPPTTENYPTSSGAVHSSEPQMFYPPPPQGAPPQSNQGMYTSTSGATQASQNPTYDNVNTFPPPPSNPPYHS
ncbi:SH3 domain-containing-like protein [Lachnellula suecica]|uniref:SH3 domain-containing-like protein n=1 Tax=Lachnellula suecica TaxID=602035 RepID=A0A8T9C7J6_9HELO|nr:SH3 domain-containing-like protein [Lachnellula suecica]